jgi:hypothetical protein
VINMAEALKLAREAIEAMRQLTAELRWRRERGL